VSPRRAWILYTLIRLGLFVAVLVVLILLGINVWISAILAALIAFAISLIALQRPRDALSADIHRWRNKGSVSDEVHDTDADVEDAAIDGAAPGDVGRPAPGVSEGEGGGEPR